MGLFSLSTCVMLLPLTGGSLAATYFAFTGEADPPASSQAVPPTTPSSSLAPPPQAYAITLWVRSSDWPAAVEVIAPEDFAADWVPVRAMIQTSSLEGLAPATEASRWVTLAGQ